MDAAKIAAPFNLIVEAVEKPQNCKNQVNNYDQKQ